jgi:hypothetical protein
MPPPPPVPPGEVPGMARRKVLPLVPGLDRPPARRRPLPDAAGVRLIAIPDSAPPYDDQRPAATGTPRRLGRLSLVTAPRAVPTPEAAPAQPGPTPARREEPAGAEWPSRFAQVLAETLAGSRSQDQIVPWTTDQARKRIRQLGPMLAGGVQPRVRRVVTSRPTSGVVEMTVIVGFGSSVRALAVRLERDGPHLASPGRAAKAARWVCTAIEAA